MSLLRFGSVVADRGYADQLADLVREWQFARVFDDFGSFARNPVQPRNPAITPITPPGTPLYPTPAPLTPTPVPSSPDEPPPSSSAPGSNPPIFTGPGFFPGSIFWGSKGPRTRKRPKRRKWWERPRTWACETDTECYEECFARGHTEQECDQMARGPMPNVPTAPPPTRAPTPTRVPQPGRVLPRVLGRVFGPVGYIFWPSETADDDVILNPELLPVPLPRGPARRPRVRTPVKRDAPERVRPPTAGTHPIPTDLPVEVPSPLPEPLPQPAPAPTTQPRPIPTSWPTSWPAPAPVPAPPIGAPAWLPFLPLAPLLFGRPGRTPGRLPRPRPGSRPNPNPPSPVPVSPPTPLTLLQPQPVPLRSRDCVETRRPKKKRQPRSECYRGTYTERRNGLIKHRREKIRCR
jgi:hypothetical protein